MTITLIDTSYSKITNFDIPIAESPSGTLPGDFQVMHIVTLNDKEAIPSVPKWKYLGHNYYSNCSHFVFTKINDSEDGYHHIIRKTRGQNIILISSFRSEENLLLDYDLYSIQYNGKLSKNKKLSLELCKIDLVNDTVICSINNASINFKIFKLQTIYQPKVLTPTIKDIKITEDNKVKLSWSGLEEYNIEYSINGDTWIAATENCLASSEYVLDNILPSTRYLFRVQSVKDNIKSEFSKPVEITTKDRILVRSIVKNNIGTMSPRVLVSPGNVQKGDLMIMQVNYTPNINIKSISHGWKLIKEFKNDDLCMNIYYKKATRKEPSSYLVHHTGNKKGKILMAISTLYSSNGLPLLIKDAEIKYQDETNTIVPPPITLQGLYALGITLIVRNIESSCEFPIDYTTLWDYEKNLRTTALFSVYNDTYIGMPKSIRCNLGSALSATIGIIEGELKEVVPPKTPTGFKAKKAIGTTVRIMK